MNLPRTSRWRCRSSTASGASGSPSRPAPPAGYPIDRLHPQPGSRELDFIITLVATLRSTSPPSPRPRTRGLQRRQPASHSRVRRIRRPGGLYHPGQEPGGCHAVSRHLIPGSCAYGASRIFIRRQGYLSGFKDFPPASRIFIRL